MPDGTFEASNVLPENAVIGDTHPQAIATRLVSATGMWRIEEVGSVQRSSLEPLWGIRLEAEGQALEQLGLLGTGKPYSLIYKLGDPDAGEALILEPAD